MRLSIELIRGAPSYINPLKERELSLRGFKLTKIENLGVTEDQYDTIDFSDNDILKLENIPLLKRLRCLIFNNNRLRKIATGLGQNALNLETVILTHNRITNLTDLEPLAEFKKLTHLSCLNNPVTKQKFYRLFVIHKLPALKTLDFVKIKPSERAESKKMFTGEEGKKREDEIREKEGAKILAPAPGSAPSEPAQTVDITPQYRLKIAAMIKKANAAEVTRLEKILASGRIPMNFLQELDAQPAPSSSSSSSSIPPPPPPAALEAKAAASAPEAKAAAPSPPAPAASGASQSVPPPAPAKEAASSKDEDAGDEEMEVEE